MKRHLRPRRPSAIRDLDALLATRAIPRPLKDTLQNIRDALDVGAELYARNQAAELTDGDMLAIEQSRAAPSRSTLTWFRQAREAGSAKTKALAAQHAQRAAWFLCQWIAGSPDDGTVGPRSAVERLRAFWPEAIASGRVLAGKHEALARLLKVPRVTEALAEDVLRALGTHALATPPDDMFRPNVTALRQRLTEIQAAGRQLAAWLRPLPIPEDGPLATQARCDHDAAMALVRGHTAITEATALNRALGPLVVIQSTLAALVTATTRALADEPTLPHPRRARPTTHASLRRCIRALADVYEKHRAGEHATARGDFLKLCLTVGLGVGGRPTFDPSPSPVPPWCRDVLRKQIARALRERAADDLRSREALTRLSQRPDRARRK
jgi:hypothetical protein